MKNYPLFKGSFGLEKENIRVDLNGHYSKTNHNKYFIEDNPYITRDFSESQIEMITQPHNTIKTALGELHNIQYVVLESINNELLWPQSNPPILPDEKSIEIAKINDTEQQQYREYLSGKYGKKTTAISGIHFNLSFSEESFKKILESEINVSEEEKNQTYLKVSKYFLKYQWLFTYLFAASPIFHETYKSTCVRNSIKNNQGECQNSNLISLRNSECGYKNDGPLIFDYSGIENLNKSTDDLVDNGRIINKSEIYENVRIKVDSNKNINYLELRFIDIDPYEFTGVKLESLEFLHAIAIFFTSLDDFDYTPDAQMLSYQKNIIINNFMKESNTLRDELKIEGLQLLRKMKDFYETITCPYNIAEIVSEMELSFKDEELSLSSKIKRDVDQCGYIDLHLNLAKKHRDRVINYPLELKNYEGLELSTKILLQAAIKNGIKSKILDYVDNFILLENQFGKKEMVKQATKTSLDNYVSVLAMESKKVTKFILESNNIQTPSGISINIKDDIDYDFLINTLPNNIVVKPNSTNFGLGITILDETYSITDLEKAISFAFSYDENILIEQYISGLEYRFLVINGNVEAILHRKAAHIIGDGKNTIQRLIKIKNSNPLRGVNYTSPLEKIKVDDQLNEILLEQELNMSSVIDSGSIIYLRKTSNISTGGDSIDVTDSVHQSYKDIAVQSAKSLNVNITGVDIIIEDITKPAKLTNHSIIELNFNPAIHIHTYPLIGSNRDIGTKIINALFPTGTL